MAGFWEVACDKCGFANTVVDGDARRSYVITRTEEVPALARPAWCNTCADVVPAEWILPLETLMTLAEHPASERPVEDPAERVRFILWCDTQDLLFAGNREAFTDEEFSRVLGILLKWRRNRRSPPRCLKCGLTSISFFPDDQSGLRHPSCGGRLLRTGCGFCEPKEEYAELYSSEGELVKKAPKRPRD